MNDTEASPKPPSEVRILHISDLHFGWGFERSLWDNLCNLAENDLKPDLVIATGDFVNNPFRWTLRAADVALQDLKQRLKQKNAACELIAVPGNHDTRLLGLVPIRWIFSAGLSLVALLIAVWWRTGIVWISTVGLFVTGLLGMMVLCFGKSKRRLKDFILSEPKEYPNLRVAIFPFDSASKGIHWARGEIERKQFVDAQSKRLTNAVYRIAILHHHPLPLPDDSSHEPMLVLNNAGVFLNEMTRLEIRLVLHGHKHHRHFSRVTINAGTDKQFELGVLATGTPTAGKKPSRFGYHFHFLRLDQNLNLKVTPYVASEGTFRPDAPFYVENPDLRARRSYEQTRALTGRHHESVVSTRTINSDGDVYHKLEYIGFKLNSKGEFVEKLSTPVIANAGGHLEWFEAGSHTGRRLPGISLALDTTDPQKYGLKHQEGYVQFGRPLGEDDPPIDFFVHYHGINSYAMSAEQHKEMYESAGAPVESAEITLKGTPTEQLSMRIKFPADFKPDGDPEFVIEPGAKSGLENLEYDTNLNLITLDVPYPALNVTYRIRWRLPEVPQHSYEPASERGHAEKIARSLLRAEIPTAPKTPLAAIVGTLEGQARTWFKLDPTEPLDVSIMVYDHKTRLLKTCAGNFEDHSPRWSWHFRYGDGVAGRAYKTHKGTVFVKDDAVRTRSPYYYYPPNGQPVADPRQIEDEVVVALPLSHPQHPGEVYAILNISSREPGSKLVEAKQREVASTEFGRGVNEACFVVFRTLY